MNILMAVAAVGMLQLGKLQKVAVLREFVIGNFMMALLTSNGLVASGQ